MLGLKSPPTQVIEILRAHKTDEILRLRSPIGPPSSGVVIPSYVLAMLIPSPQPLAGSRQQFSYRAVAAGMFLQILLLLFFPTNASNIISFSAGTGRVCVVDSLAQVRCWGQQTALDPSVQGVYGTLTNWTQDSPRAMIQPPFPWSTQNILLVSGQYQSVCAINSTFHVGCWGPNFYGEATIPAGLSASIDVCVGMAHACALSLNRLNITCWGDATLGQSTVPTAIINSMLSGGGNISLLSCGWMTSCVTTSRGGTYCWGGNILGQLIPDTLQPPGSCAFATTGTSVSFYIDSATKAINGTSLYSDARKVSPAGAYSRVWAEDRNSCAQTTQGTFVCWGLDLPQTTVPAAFQNDLVDFSKGSFGGCGIDNRSYFECFGSENGVAPYKILSARPFDLTAWWPSSRGNQRGTGQSISTARGPRVPRIAFTYTPPVTSPPTLTGYSTPLVTASGNLVITTRTTGGLNAICTVNAVNGTGHCDSTGLILLTGASSPTLIDGRVMYMASNATSDRGGRNTFLTFFSDPDTLGYSYPSAISYPANINATLFSCPGSCVGLASGLGFWCAQGDTAIIVKFLNGVFITAWIMNLYAGQLYISTELRVAANDDMILGTDTGTMLRASFNATGDNSFVTRFSNTFYPGSKITSMTISYDGDYFYATAVDHGIAYYRISDGSRLTDSVDLQGCTVTAPALTRSGMILVGIQPTPGCAARGGNVVALDATNLNFLWEYVYTYTTTFLPTAPVANALDEVYWGGYETTDAAQLNCLSCGTLFAVSVDRTGYSDIWRKPNFAAIISPIALGPPGALAVTTMSELLYITDVESPSMTPTQSPSASSSLSASLSPSTTVAPSQTISLTLSPSISSSHSQSATWTPTYSASAGASSSLTATLTTSLSLSPTLTASPSPSISTTLTSSVHATASVTTSSTPQSPLPTPSTTVSGAPSQTSTLSTSISASGSGSVSPTTGVSGTPTSTPGGSTSTSPSAGGSPISTISSSVSASPSLSASGIVSATLTNSITPTRSAASASLSGSSFVTSSLSSSFTPLATVSITSLQSAAASISVSATATVSAVLESPSMTQSTTSSNWPIYASTTQQVAASASVSPTPVMSSGAMPSPSASSLASLTSSPTRSASFLNGTIPALPSPTEPVAVASPPPVDSLNSAGKAGSVSTGAIAGISVGLVFFLLALCLRCALRAYCGRRKQSRELAEIQRTLEKGKAAQNALTAILALEAAAAAGGGVGSDDSLLLPAPTTGSTKVLFRDGLAHLGLGDSPSAERPTAAAVAAPTQGGGQRDKVPSSGGSTAERARISAAVANSLLSQLDASVDEGEEDGEADTTPPSAEADAASGSSPLVAVSNANDSTAGALLEETALEATLSPIKAKKSARKSKIGFQSVSTEAVSSFASLVLQAATVVASEVSPATIASLNDGVGDASESNLDFMQSVVETAMRDMDQLLLAADEEGGEGAGVVQVSEGGADTMEEGAAAMSGSGSTRSIAVHNRATAGGRAHAVSLYRVGMMGDKKQRSDATLVDVASKQLLLSESKFTTSTLLKEASGEMKTLRSVQATAVVAEVSGVAEGEALPAAEIVQGTDGATLALNGGVPLYRQRVTAKGVSGTVSNVSIGKGESLKRSVRKEGLQRSQSKEALELMSLLRGSSKVEIKALIVKTVQASMRVLATEILDSVTDKDTATLQEAAEMGLTLNSSDSLQAEADTGGSDSDSRTPQSTSLPSSPSPPAGGNVSAQARLLLRKHREIAAAKSTDSQYPSFTWFMFYLFFCGGKERGKRAISISSRKRPSRAALVDTKNPPCKVTDDPSSTTLLVAFLQAKKDGGLEPIASPPPSSSSSSSFRSSQAPDTANVGKQLKPDPLIHGGSKQNPAFDVKVRSRPASTAEILARVLAAKLSSNAALLKNSSPLSRSGAQDASSSEGVDCSNPMYFRANPKKKLETDTTRIAFGSTQVGKEGLPCSTIDTVATAGDIDSILQHTGLRAARDSGGGVLPVPTEMQVAPSEQHANDAGNEASSGTAAAYQIASSKLQQSAPIIASSTALQSLRDDAPSPDDDWTWDSWDSVSTAQESKAPALAAAEVPSPIVVVFTSTAPAAATETTAAAESSSRFHEGVARAGISPPLLSPTVDTQPGSEQEDFLRVNPLSHSLQLRLKASSSMTTRVGQLGGLKASWKHSARGIFGNASGTTKLASSTDSLAGETSVGGSSALFGGGKEEAGGAFRLTLPVSYRRAIVLNSLEPPRRKVADEEDAVVFSSAERFVPFGYSSTSARQQSMVGHISSTNEGPLGHNSKTRQLVPGNSGSSNNPRHPALGQPSSSSSIV